MVVVCRSGAIFYEWMYDMKMKQSNSGIQTKAYPTGNIRQRLVEITKFLANSSKVKLYRFRWLTRQHLQRHTHIGGKKEARKD